MAPIPRGGGVAVTAPEILCDHGGVRIPARKTYFPEAFARSFCLTAAFTSNVALIFVEGDTDRRFSKMESALGRRAQVLLQEAQRQDQIVCLIRIMRRRLQGAPPGGSRRNGT